MAYRRSQLPQRRECGCALQFVLCAFQAGFCLSSFVNFTLQFRIEVIEFVPLALGRYQESAGSFRPPKEGECGKRRKQDGNDRDDQPAPFLDDPVGRQEMELPPQPANLCNVFDKPAAANGHNASIALELDGLELDIRKLPALGNQPSDFIVEWGNGPESPGILSGKHDHAHHYSL